MAISTYFKGDISMKKRLHDKKAGIALLVALIIVALTEMIFRIVAPMKELWNTSDVKFESLKTKENMT